MYNVIRTFVLLHTLQLTNSPKIAAGSDHDERTNSKLDSLLDFSGLQVEFDGIVFLDAWVRVADRSSIVATNSWDAFAASVGLSDFQQLELLGKPHRITNKEDIRQPLQGRSCGE